MKLLLFEIIPGKIWRYTTQEYELKDDFYIFIDLKDKETYKYHKSLYRGESRVEA